MWWETQVASRWPLMHCPMEGEGGGGSPLPGSTEYRMPHTGTLLWSPHRQAVIMQPCGSGLVPLQATDFGLHHHGCPLLLSEKHLHFFSSKDVSSALHGCSENFFLFMFGAERGDFRVSGPFPNTRSQIFLDIQMCSPIPPVHCF